MNNLLERALSGLVFITVIIGSIFWHPNVYAVVFGLIVGWSLLEFYTIVAKDEVSAGKWVGVLSGVFLFAGSFGYAQKIVGARIFIFLIPLYITLLVCRLYYKGSFSFRGGAYTIAGLVYIAVPLALCNGLVFPHLGQYTPWILAGFFILLWTNDTFAYLTGTLLGKHRLFERISPKKSWEGFFGGLFFTMAGAFLIAYLFPPELAHCHWIAMAVIVVVFGVFGDLLESLLKRNMGIKDSGRFLPGHGGILDRFDAVLLAAPMVYCYLALFAF